MKNDIVATFFVVLLFVLHHSDCSSRQNIFKSNELNALNFDPPSLTIEAKSTKTIRVSLLDPSLSFDKTINITFTYGDENEILNSTDIIQSLPTISFTPNEKNKTFTLVLKAEHAGHVVIGALSDEINIPLTNIFRIDVVHSSVLNIFIEIVGWIYFIAWSVSFYPQTILNFQLKNVAGLSFDFIALNFLGFSCYTVFNVSFYWVKEVQNEYSQKHPRGVNPVQLNDVFFSIHAVMLTSVTIVQCLMYRRPLQRVSYQALGICCVLITFLAISGIITATGTMKVLEYMYFFSYVKLAITIMKYCPQVFMNYKRKSTVGWSIVNVLLDFTGGSFSLLQMFFLSYNYGDWSSIFGSPTKLGLGLLSILFDIIFMAQHYIFYKEIREVESYSPIA